MPQVSLSLSLSLSLARARARARALSRSLARSLARDVEEARGIGPCSAGNCVHVGVGPLLAPPRTVCIANGLRDTGFTVLWLG